MSLRTTGIATLVSLLITPALHASDLKVLTAGAYQEVVTELVPAFERQTGNHVIIETATAGALAKQIQEGEKFDLVISSDSVIDTLSRAGMVAPASRTPLAQVGVAVCIKAGSPPPDISTVDAFKRAMLAAKSIAYIDPASGGSSGIYLDQLFVKLGIADQIRPKAKLKQGGRVADLVASGEAELGIQQMSELMSTKGVTLVGPLPPQIQNVTTYTAAVSSKTSDATAARALLHWLNGPQSAPVLREKGMTPAK